jgi:hypothetical protein
MCKVNFAITREREKERKREREKERKREREKEGGGGRVACMRGERDNQKKVRVYSKHSCGRALGVPVGMLYGSKLPHSVSLSA